MDKAHRKIMPVANSCPVKRISKTVAIMPKCSALKFYAMWTVIAAVVFIVTGCDRPVLPHAQFIHLPESGWKYQSPVTFHPVYDDSTRTYDITLAVRHQSNYAFATLPLAVDIVDADSVVHRQLLDMRLADEYGNWSGGGFGTLYQQQTSIARGIKPSEVASVVVWQALDSTHSLKGVVDVGIFCNPSDI